MADKTQNVKTRLSFDGEAEYKAACKEINSTLKVLNSEMKLVTAEYKDNASSVDALKAKQAVLQKTYDEQAKKVKETEAALEKCRKATGDNSEESKKLETQLNYQKAALVKTEQELGKTTDEMEKAEKAADEMGKEIKDSGEQADDAKGKFSGFTSVLSGMGTALKAAAAATAAAVAGAATAIGALTTKAIEGYAAQEQLVGGVETLFKTSSDTVVGYANDAYKTAGMSANEYMETVTEFIEAAAHNKIIQLVVLAIVCDTVFGVLRAIKEKKFNSCAGIDGAIRKVGMLISLVFMLAIDVLIKINLIGFIPEQARTYLGLDTVGVAEFFALLYIAYEVVSIFKNMALCGLPVKKVWEKVREFLAKYTDELPDTDELDGDSTTGNVEEHRTQER